MCSAVTHIRLQECEAPDSYPLPTTVQGAIDGLWSWQMNKDYEVYKQKPQLMPKEAVALACTAVRVNLTSTLDADEMMCSRYQVRCWIYEEADLTVDDFRSVVKTQYEDIHKSLPNGGLANEGE